MNDFCLPARGQGPNLVLIHGWGMHPGVWGDLGKVLEQYFCVHRVALPGHGGLPERPGWGPQELAAELLQAIPDARWMGWSLGAMVALAAALQAPNRVPGLILLNATPRFVQGPDWACAMRQTAFDDFRSRCEVAPEATLNRFLALATQGNREAGTTFRDLKGQLDHAPPPSRTGLLDGLRVLEQEDYRDALTRLSVPTLWISGDGDQVTPATAARRGAEMMNNGRYEELFGSGHASLQLHAAQIANFCQSTLSTVPA